MTEVADVVTKMYHSYDRILEPLYPWLLVRPLPKSKLSDGGIILVEKQNKPNHEAVVLATWKPFWENVEKENTETGEVLKVRVWNESDLKPGDHIVHPHHVGLPDAVLPDNQYRMIREEDVFCTLHYRDSGWLRKELREQLKQGWDGKDSWDALMVDIFEKFDIVPKHGYQPMTLSGV